MRLPTLRAGESRRWAQLFPSLGATLPFAQYNPIDGRNLSHEWTQSFPSMDATFPIVIPAYAGIQRFRFDAWRVLDPRFRGDDEGFGRV